MMKNTDALVDISVGAKARLARLLATENINVEHRPVETAMFDLKNRTLVLPNWASMSEHLYDMLVLHEVGHALFTPLAGFHETMAKGKPAGYKGFLNVIEDARIEKKIQRKFPGGRRDFVAGYKELDNRDFFGTKGRTVESYCLIDRINLYFKMGAHLDVPFSAEEQVFVDRTAGAETWEEVVSIVNDLWDYATQDSETDKSNHNDPAATDAEDGDDPADESQESSPGEPSDGDSADEMGDGDEADSTDGDGDEADSTDGDGDGDSGEEDKPNSGTAAAGDGADVEEASKDPSDPSDTGTSKPGKNENEVGAPSIEPFSETDQASRTNEKSLANVLPEGHKAIAYFQVPRDETFDLEKIIIPVDMVVDSITTHAVTHAPDALGEAKEDLIKFRANNKRVVNYLAKEFEMRKAAKASQRASIAKTGRIDVNKLHSYRWNEDIFKKLNVVQDGKSHGLQLFVDWSGSMQPNLAGTIDQVLNLALFCKAVSIPFDVYAFSTYAYRITADSTDPVENDRFRGHKMIDAKLEDGDLYVDKGFNLIHLMTSKASTAKFNAMLVNLMMIRTGLTGRRYDQDSWARSNYGSPSMAIPSWIGLGGTPLSESILCTIPIVNRFRAVNGLELVNVVYLTDGDGCGITSHWDAQTKKVSDNYRKSGYGGPVVLRDPISKKEWNGNGTASEQSALLDIVRERTGAKIANFYIVSPRERDFMYEFLNATGDGGGHSRYGRRVKKADMPISSREAWLTAKAEGGVVVPNPKDGWDDLYLVLGGESIQVMDDDLLGDDTLNGASASKLHKAFSKMAGNKVRTRMILHRFIGLIAEK